MGDRANVNIINKTRNHFTGVNLYSHYEGAEFHLKALKPFIDNLVSDVDYSYGMATIVANAFKGYGHNGLGIGMLPIMTRRVDEAYSYQQDNEHDILTFDYHGKLIVIYDIRTDETFKFEFTADGAIEACKHVIRTNSEMYSHFANFNLDTKNEDFSAKLEDHFKFVFNQ